MAVGLVLAMPAAMLPAQQLGAATVNKAATTATPAVVQHQTPLQKLSLPTVAGGRTGTGEGAIQLAPAPSPSNTSAISGEASKGLRSDAVVGTPPSILMPSILNVPDPTQPNDADRTASTFDSVTSTAYPTGSVVDFGGCKSGMSASCTSWTNATYLYNGTTWALQSPSTSPSARTDSTLTFDPSNGTAVLFGGENASGALSDTWIWNGTTWTQYTGTTHPSARHGAVAAYLGGKIYLFGGQSGTTYLNDTWSWSGSAWTQLSPTTSPSVRALASMSPAGTLGTSANDLILYGGTNSTGDLGDTWLWNGTNWSEPSLTEGPGPLEQAAMAYDPTLSVPVLFGGVGAGVAAMWAWNGSEWMEGAGYQSVDLYGITMAQDPANGQLVVNGGEYSSSSTNYETFKVDYLNSHPRSSTEFTHQLDDRLTETVNPTSTDASLSQDDFNINGVGLSLNISQNFDFEGGCVSRYLTCGWTAGILDVAAYTQPDGHSVVLEMPDGSLTYCPYSGTTWTCAAGSDLAYRLTSGTYQIVELHSQITYNLNSNLQVSTVTDHNGDTITFNYSGGTQATSITDTEGRTTSLSYAGGHLHVITDPAGRTVTLGYGGWWLGAGGLNSIAVADPSDPSGTATTNFTGGSAYNVVTPAGSDSEYSLGSMNRVNDVSRVTNLPATGDVSTTDYLSYPENGQVIVTDPNGNAATYTITPAGNGISLAVDALGHQRSTTYNAASDPQVLTNGLTQATTLAWDTNNNLNQITSPATASGQTPANSYFAYNTTGAGGGSSFLASSAADAETNCSAFSYDATGNETKAVSGLTETAMTTNCNGRTSNPSGAQPTTVTSGYQGDTGVASCGGRSGELCTTTSGAGNITHYAYDSHGQLTSVTEPGGSCVAGSRSLCTTITYDSLGRPATVTDGKGQTTTYTYDKFDRITQILYNGTTVCHTGAGTCLLYTYDADGDVLTRVDSYGTTTFTYDSIDRLVGEQLPAKADKCAGAGGPITFSYDAASNLITYCDAGGTVNYHYNADSLNDGVGTDGGSCTPGAVVQPCTSYAYTNANDPSAITKITYPTSSGVTDTLGYDGASNQTSELVSKTGSTLEAMLYSYANGTNDSQLEQASLNYLTGAGAIYSYDNMDRLLVADSSSSDPTCSTASDCDTYSYDSDGNLKTQDLKGTSQTFQYNADDALCWAVSGSSSNACTPTPTGATTYSYDANGNQTGSSAGESISYNSANQTTSMTPAGGSALAMTYTGTNSTQRTSVGSTTLSNSIFGVALSKTGSTNTYYTWDATGRLNSILVGSTRYYVYYNGAGSVGGVFNGSGTNVASYAYDPYGTTTATGSNPSVSSFQFKGGYQDPGFYKFGTRFENTATGSWTQQDSIAGTIQDPGAVNRYPYAGDDPVNAADPTGDCLLYVNGVCEVESFPDLLPQLEQAGEACANGVGAGYILVLGWGFGTAEAACTGGLIGQAISDIESLW